MKTALRLLVACVVLAATAWAISAAEEMAAEKPSVTTEGKMEAKEPAKMQMEACPACGMMMGTRDEEMMKRHEEMMAKAGVSGKLVHRCQAMMNATLHEDSPAVLLAAADMLNLTDEQKAKLEEMDKEAREKARGVLTTDQHKKLEDLAGGKMTMREGQREIHAKMMPMMREMTREGKCCCCPMMMRRGGRQERERQAAKIVNSKCPITSAKLDPAKEPDSLIREYKGQKVGFCCDSCPPEWDKLTDAQKDAKLKAAM